MLPPLHRRIGFSRIGLIAIMLLVVSLAGGSHASTAVLANTNVGPKPGSTSLLPETSGGTTSLRAPEPGSKNATIPPAFDPNGVTTSGPAAPGSKNHSGEVSAAMQTTASPSGWRFTACGSIADGGWTTTSESFQSIVSCTLNFPESGVVYLRGSTSLGRKDSDFEARLNITIDTTIGNSSTDRWINVYGDGGDGTDKNAEVSLVSPITAGAHTFHFSGLRYTGTGTVQLYDPSLSVLFFPNSSADVLTCGASGNTIWNTTESSFKQIRSCALDVPQSGYVYLNGSGSVGLAQTNGQPYEARFRLGVDSLNGTGNSDRWVNVYTDSGDGTDEAVATSLLSSVAAGAHTFYFSGALYNGVGPVQLYDPALSVLYFPAPNVTAKVCGSNANDTWTNSTGTYSVIRSCTLNVPDNGFAFMDATASAGLNDNGAGNDWEGQFRVGVDSDVGFSQFDRWVNVYTDNNDGTDRPVSAGGMVNINKGAHTFYFVGRRFAGAGTLRLYSPSLTVIVPGATTYIPLASK